MTPPPTADAARAYAAASAAPALTAPRRNPDARLTAHGQDVDATALVAVVDVLVVKALEAVGKRIVRADRARFNALKGRPSVGHRTCASWNGQIGRAHV